MIEQNLSLYRIFYTVANTGNISKAARELYISQPAISKSISKLEANMQTPLFIRSSRGVTLTSEGQLLYEHVKTAFEALNRGENELTRIKKLGIGHIRIGVSTTICKYLLMPYLKQYIARYPHIMVTVENQSTAQTIAMLEQQHIDVGIIAAPRTAKSIIFTPITKFEDVFTASPSYLENLKIREGTLTDYFSQGTFMLLDQKNMTRHYIDSYLNEQQIVISHLLEVSTMDLIIEFAKIGLGIGCCIKEAVLDELNQNSLVQIPLETPIPKRTVGFAVASGAPVTQAMQNFVDLLQAPQD